MTTARLDAKTENALRRLTSRRGQTKSEVIRDAIARLAGEEGEQVTAAQKLQSFIGLVDSGGQQLSERTGQKLRERLDLPASEPLQKAVHAELGRQELLAETDRYVADLVAEVGPPTAAQRTRAAAVASRLARRPAGQVGRRGAQGPAV